MLLSAAIQVMIVGTFHMSNPGHDLHNVHAADVLAPEKQAELANIAAALAKFRPTKVAAEWPAGLVAERYAKFTAGTLDPSRNEVVQLGFRLAKDAGAAMHGIDVDGDFPYEPVQKYAAAHGEAAVLDELGARVEAQTREVEKAQEKSIAAALRQINDPQRLSSQNGFYRTVLHLGEPGVNLVTAWYRRNFEICANLQRLAKPGDRVAVFYGYGHAFLLRQCVAETPGFELVEPNDYLPR